MDEQAIVVVSNRGPVAFRRDANGSLNAHRGAGGLVSGLTPLLQRPGRTWVAAALSDADRAAVAADPDVTDRRVVAHRTVEVGGIRAVLAAIDAADLTASYDDVCNATLWYVHHHLFDLARAPVFDDAWFDAWESYRRVNDAFADLVATIAPADAAVLIQDYHLYLVGSRLARRRPDLAVVHFAHTPFADAHQFAVLPDQVRLEILEGLAAYRACGFHTSAWERSYLACAAADAVAPAATFVAPLGPDAADLEATRSSAAFSEATERLDAAVGDRACLARSDRIELSKNLIRGFRAFDTLLDRHPEWRGRVCFVASVYPSREANPDYAAYRTETEACVAAINDRWATPEWTPILLDTTDDFPLSVATLARADVVLVNSVRDGLNLVASEAMLVNDRDALLALSPHAGVWEVLGEAAEAVQPWDVRQTAEVLHRLLATDTAERRTRARRLRELAASRTPADWLDDQLAASGRPLDD